MARKDPAALKPEWIFVEETRDFWDEGTNGGAGAFAVNRKNALWDRNIFFGRGLSDQEVNLVGLLKGDVERITDSTRRLSNS